MNFGAFSGGYIEAEVTEGDGMIGFERIEVSEPKTLLGLNAVDILTGTGVGGSTNSFSAQLAFIADTIFTNIQLINTSVADRKLTLRAVDAAGGQLAPPVEKNLGAGGVLSGDFSELFSLSSPGRYWPAGPMPVVGSLRVEADGPGVIGDVIFGNPTLSSAAALQLQSKPFLEAVFSQVANTDQFFTGLALFCARRPGRASSDRGLCN